jgi:hypothetical protein
MAKYDLDNSHADPRARRSNRLALAGLLATFGIAIGASYLQSHPWQTGGQTQSDNWYASVRYQDQDWQATGSAVYVPETQMHRIGTTDDRREVFERRGGGGGGGGAGPNGSSVGSQSNGDESPLYVKLAAGYFLPIALR